MKKVYVKNAFKVESHRNVETMRNDIYAEGDDSMQISDGYHTIDELYDHRITLYIALCKSILNEDESARSFGGVKRENRVWRSKLHSDGSSFDGWFILGIGKEKGKQITYHLPNIKWDEVSFAETLEKAPEWDGHAPADVITRLKNL